MSIWISTHRLKKTAKIIVSFLLWFCYKVIKFRASVAFFFVFALTYSWIRKKYLSDEYVLTIKIKTTCSPTCMLLKRSIRKNVLFEKKKWLSRKHANALLELEWHWHSFSLVIFFYSFFFFTTPWMTLLINAVLVAIKRFVLSIHLILFFVYQVCLHKLQLRLRRLELWGEFRTSHDIGHFLGQSVRIVGPASITGLLMRLRD